jgi:hypothetical protein
VTRWPEEDGLSERQKGTFYFSVAGVRERQKGTFYFSVAGVRERQKGTFYFSVAGVRIKMVSCLELHALRSVGGVTTS